MTDGTCGQLGVGKEKLSFPTTGALGPGNIGSVSLEKVNGWTSLGGSGSPEDPAGLQQLLGAVDGAGHRAESSAPKQAVWVQVLSPYDHPGQPRSRTGIISQRLPWGLAGSPELTAQTEFSLTQPVSSGPRSSAGLPADREEPRRGDLSLWFQGQTPNPPAARWAGASSLGQLGDECRGGLTRPGWSLCSASKKPGLQTSRV